jgi:hypothetical protein
MLFPDIAHRNLPAFAVGDCDPEEAFAQEDAFSMVPKSAMPKVWEEGFGLVKPVVDRKVILGPASESSGAVFGVLHWVSHGYTS